MRAAPPQQDISSSPPLEEEAEAEAPPLPPKDPHRIWRSGRPPGETSGKMSAALAKFAEDPKSVSAQLKPHLESVEAIRKEYSIAEDSGLDLEAAGKLKNGQQAAGAVAAANDSMEEEDAHAKANLLTPPSHPGLAAPNIMVTKATGSVSPLPRHDSEGRGPLPEPGTGKLRPFLTTLGTGPQEGRSDSVMMMSPGSVDINEEEEAWAAVSRTFKPIADTLRTDRLREQLGETNLAAACVLILRISSTQRTSKYLAPLQEAQVEIMRVIANLCIDSDTNRGKMLELEPIPAILAIVEDLLDDPVPDLRALKQFDTPTLSLLRAATGAVLNLQLDHPATRRALGTNALSLRTLYRLASSARIYTPNCWAVGDHGFARAARGSQKEAANMERIRIGSTISTWAWRILQDVNSSGASGTGDAEEEMMSVAAGGSPSDALLTSAIINATAVALRAFLQETSTDSSNTRHNDILPWMSEDVSSLIESDIEILTASSELIESSCLDVPSARLEAVSPTTWADPIRYPQGLGPQERNPLQLYAAFFEKAQPPDSWTGTSRTRVPEDIKAVREAAKQFSQDKAAVARSVVAIAGEDRSMEALFNSADAAWFMDTLKHWVQLRGANREDLSTIALLTLGNLARTDAHCIAMIEQHKLGDLLAPILADPNVEVKLAHGMVGLLKNLAIPKQNKDPIGALGVMEASARFLDKSKDMVQPLQFGTVGLLKHLCSGSTSNAIKLCNGPVLDALLDINRRTEDMPTKMESTRVLFNVIKTLWGTQNDSEGALASAKSKICQPATAKALAEMIRHGSRYPILVNEGIVALTLLSTSATGAEVVSAELMSWHRRGSAQSEDKRHSPEIKAPRRKGTADSMVSNASQPPPPPEDALGMVVNVISRRDARMPPQYASNACSLLIAIFEATKSSGTASAPTSDGMDTSKDEESSSSDTSKKVAERTLASLELLAKQGPSEAVAAAKQALQLATQRLQG